LNRLFSQTIAHLLKKLSSQFVRCIVLRGLLWKGIEDIDRSLYHSLLDLCSYPFLKFFAKEGIRRLCNGINIRLIDLYRSRLLFGNLCSDYDSRRGVSALDRVGQVLAAISLDGLRGDRTLRRWILRSLLLGRSWSRWCWCLGPFSLSLHRMDYSIVVLKRSQKFS